MLNRLLAVFVAILIALPATSLTAAPTDEQIRQFKNLSPQQQAAVKASYLGGGAATGSTTQPLDTPENVLPMMNDSTSQIEEAAIESTDETTLEEKKEEKKIEEKLEQFGYDLFAGEATTFAPVSDIPVPSEYVIGPGDTLQIFLFGKESVEHQLQVSREGELNFPGIGPIQVAGMRFDELKTSLNQRISQQMIGVRASITLGRLRSIRVFILGDVRRPGSYTVSALSTMTNALFVSGGVTKIGSLRNVQLKRRGNVVTTLDLYDLLLKGDTSQDARIQPGDVLFVPPIGEVAGIGGEVRRPALYELKQERTVADLVQMAGGILPTADLKSAQIERINPMGERILLDLDLAAAQSQGIELISGDAIRVYSILDKMEAIVQLAGHVQRSGGSQWFEGMRLSALLRSTRDVLQEADLGYVLIEREGLHGGKLDVLTASLTEAWEKPGAEGDPLLLPRDYVTVLSLGKSRAQPISKVVQKLKQEERFGQRANVVSVAGNVRFAGDYPYQQEMTVADLVKAALNVLPITDMDYSVLIREVGEARKLEVSAVSLAQAMQRPGQHPLLPGDRLIVLGLETDRVKQLSSVTSRLQQEERFDQPAKVVTINGSVKHPGVYPHQQGMTVAALVNAAMNVLPETDMGYSILRREVGVSRQLEVLSVSLREAMLHPEKFQLALGDVITVFSNKNEESNEEARSRVIEDLMDDLRKQATLDKPFPMVAVGGLVKFPGKYPLETGMGLNRLLVAAGGLDEAAYTLEAELTHRQIVDGAYRELSHEVISLEQIQNGQQQDIELQPYDYLNIRKVPLWDEREFVTIEGEVLFPGTYPVSRGETLYGLMQRAGGVTDYAFVEGAVFMREQLRKKEQKEMDAVANQLEKQISAISLEESADATQKGEIATAKELVAQLRTSPALGRLAIELGDLIHNPDQSLTIKGGDHLVVPSRSQEVTVLGEVFYPTSHMHESDKSRLDYVNMSGGATKLADTSNVYVVRANGKVLAAKRIAWFRAAHDEEIRPGDTVVVPLDVKPTNFMASLKDISQILYQLATTTAALQTVGAI